MQASTDDVRDLAGEIEWAKASLISPEGYAAAVAEVGRDIPFDAAKVADGLRRLRGAEGPPRRHHAAGLRRPAAAHRRRHRERRRRRPGVPRPLPLLRRRRVPGRHAAAAARARRLARRPRRPDRRRRRQPDHLLVHRRHAAATCWTSRGASPTPRWCAWNATTAPPRRWCRWPTASSPRPAAGWRAASCTWSASATPGPTPTFNEHPDEVAEAAAVAKAHQEADRSRHRAVGDRGAVPHQRAVGGVRGGAHRGGHRLPGARRRGVLQPPGDPAGAAGAAARRRARRRRRPAARGGPRSCSNRWA